MELRSSCDACRWAQRAVLAHWRGSVCMCLACCAARRPCRAQPFSNSVPIMAEAGEEPRRRTFRKYSYRGVDLDQLLDMNPDELVDLFHARARRK